MILMTKLLLVSILLTSCAAPIANTPTPEMEISAPTEIVATETTVSTVTQDAPAAAMQTQSTTDDSSNLPDGFEVEIEDFAYVSAVITVKVGTTVTWENKDQVQHTVTSDSGLFDSGLLAKGVPFSFTFTEAGTYTYHCTPHPLMKGTVIVE
jgi:amicyanin